MEQITIPLSEYQELSSRMKSLEAKIPVLLLRNQESNQELIIHNQNLVAHNQELTAHVQKLLLVIKELEAKNKALEEKVISLNNKIYGKKKDKIKEENAVANSNKASKKNKKGAGRKPTAETFVPDETIKYDFESTPKCECCNQEMHFVGNDGSNHADYQIVFKKIKIMKAKYACRGCNKIVIANGAKLPIAKGTPMPGLLTQVILEKFGNASPAYRQAQNYGYMNIDYSRQMLCNWYGQAAYLMEPLVDLICKEIISSKYLAGDETPIQLLDMEGKVSGGNAHMCVIKQTSNDFNFVYCWPIESRRQEIIRSKLSGFRGYLQTDGLTFYTNMEDDVISVGCWAHARRKFVEVANLAGKEKGVASEVITMIGELYDIERKGSSLSLADLKELRKKESKIVMRKIRRCLKKHEKLAPPKSGLGKAINYTLKRWKALNEYIKNPNLSIDNNATERCIKYVVMGRKNWLFTENIESAKRLAILYSLMISCKFNNVNPRVYFEYILTQLPYINKREVDKLKQLLPDRFDVNKRFDLEYRKERGISETIIEHATQEENKLVA